MDVDVGRAAALADDFDGFQGVGRLGHPLGSTFLAVERRTIWTTEDVYDEGDTTSSRKNGGRSLI